MSRLENTGRNALWSFLANITYILLGMVGRYVFLKVLNETYLGISSLFNSLINVLSFADLGLASAFTFCFYKPIADNDILHIQAVLNAFRRYINVIAGLIGVVGLLMIPFLRYFVKGGESIDDTMLVIYYLITMANTLLSYWLMYKTCYITAAQKAYKLVPFTIGGNLMTVIAQIAVLLLVKSYVAWALCAPLIGALRNVAMDVYIKKEFPETSFNSAKKLFDEDKKSIISNVKAAVWHRLGAVCVAQTDSIIVSSMINISITGLLSNYELIKLSVLDFVSLIRNAVIPGIGDLTACESKEVQKNVLYTYMMVNYCIVGFAMCGVGILSSPFISLIFGPEKTIDELTITLSCVGFYFANQTYALNVFPTAAGRMMLGAWAAVLEGISNLIISIWAVRMIGLPGVYVGTVASQFINYLVRPFSIFKGLYGEKPYKYFGYTMAYFAVSMVAYGILFWLRTVVVGDAVTILNFALLAVTTVVVFFGTAWIFWHRTKYGREVLAIIRQSIESVFRRSK